MKIDFQFNAPQDTDDPEFCIVPFSIVGGVRIKKIELVTASQESNGLYKIEQKALARLSAFLQVELYGRIISDEVSEKKDETS